MCDSELDQPRHAARSPHHRTPAPPAPHAV